MNTHSEYFNDSYLKFETSLLRSVSVSESRIGVPHTGRQNRTLMVFAKLILHAVSIKLICDKALESQEGNRALDHFSIGVLTRALIDTGIMAMYLSEPKLSLAEWDLRRHVLFLHDLANRRRFMTALLSHSKEKAPPDDQEKYRAAKSSILAVLEARCLELSIAKERKEELSKGQLVFIDGVRGAVREAGFDLEHFEFLHTYLSNQVHGHPASFLRADEQKISFEEPSDFQLSFCGVCLEAAAQYLDAVVDRVEAFTGSINLDPNGHID